MELSKQEMELSKQEMELTKQEMELLPHSAPSWILSLAENLASSNLQDGATKWHYYLNSYHIACATDPPHSLRNRPIVLVVTNIFDLVR